MIVTGSVTGVNPSGAASRHVSNVLCTVAIKREGLDAGQLAGIYGQRCCAGVHAQHFKVFQVIQRLVFSSGQSRVADHHFVGACAAVQLCARGKGAQLIIGEGQHIITCATGKSEASFQRSVAQIGADATSRHRAAVQAIQVRDIGTSQGEAQAFIAAGHQFGHCGAYVQGADLVAVAGGGDVDGGGGGAINREAGRRNTFFVLEAVQVQVDRGFGVVGSPNCTRSSGSARCGSQRYSNAFARGQAHATTGIFHCQLGYTGQGGNIDAHCVTRIDIIQHFDVFQTQRHSSAAINLQGVGACATIQLVGSAQSSRGGNAAQESIVASGAGQVVHARGQGNGGAAGGHVVLHGGDDFGDAVGIRHGGGIAGHGGQPGFHCFQARAAHASVGQHFSGGVQCGGKGAGSGDFVGDDGGVGALGALVDGVSDVADGQLALGQLVHPVVQTFDVGGMTEQVLVYCIYQLGVVHARVQ